MGNCLAQTQIIISVFFFYFFSIYRIYLLINFYYFIRCLKISMKKGKIILLPFLDYKLCNYLFIIWIAILLTWLSIKLRFQSFEKRIENIIRWFFFCSDFIVSQFSSGLYEIFHGHIFFKISLLFSLLLNFFFFFSFQIKIIISQRRGVQVAIFFIFVFFFLGSMHSMLMGVFSQRL